MSNPDDEKGGPQIVPGAPDGAPTDPEPTNEESEERRAEEHDSKDGGTSDAP